LGYSFLRNGFMAGYGIENMEFDCFIIRAKTEEESEGMLNQLLEKKKDIPLDRTKAGIHYVDKYYHNVYMAVVNNHVCGVIKIKPGKEGVGEKYLELLKEALSK
ncbi:MAG: hypothetical protein MUP70_11705, partial [Candidatus Aminicenantes bacterium]|nr:hypothetical protein [Candidatus Aminicenantes bacterium]